MDFFYIKTINSSNSKRKIIITRDRIKKSFLFIFSPPFFSRRLAPPNLLNVPKSIIPNYCSIINVKLIKMIKKRRAMVVNEYIFPIDKTHFSIGRANRVCAKEIFPFEALKHN